MCYITIMKMDFLKNKKLVIFDMDGTLIDSLGVWNEVDRRVVSLIRRDGKEEMGNMQELRDEALRVFSTSPNPYFEYCLFLKEKYKSELTKEEIYNLRYKIAGELLEKDINYKPYAPELIKELKSKGYLLAIASTTQGKNMAIYRHKNKNIISKANIDDYFDVVYSRDDCYEIKPHPEVFCKVLSTLNVSASDALVFEDSLVGVEASKRAGIECCAVYDEYSDHDREKINALADHTINSFLDLF